MGRSKRPPSFGRSAGERLTVMRPAGNSKPEWMSAARTRSLLSLTTVAASPTMQNVGSPPARLTSTWTRGAVSPSCARHATRATATSGCSPCAPRRSARARGLAAGRRRATLERCESRLERFEPRAGALQDLGLRVKFVAVHQIKLAQALAQDRAEVALQVLLHAAQRRRHA